MRIYEKQNLGVIDWDRWRADYETSSFDEMKAFYREVARAHPVQRSFDVTAAMHAFEIIERDCGFGYRVVELGGWDGALAQAMLSTRSLISGWVNYDIVRVEQVCDDARYFPVELTRPFWDRPKPIWADVFVACHTIEHLSRGDLILVLDAFQSEWVYLEAPLLDEGQSWRHYPGSHKLDAGWNWVYERLRVRGYELVDSYANARLWRNR